jgi:aryl-alcohol dehydrogenase-like predicted oxidoreductase
MMLPSDTMPVQLLLGTAMWGWTVSRPTCFDLLDTFYAAGFRQVDAAVNYPINKNPDDSERQNTSCWNGSTLMAFSI